MGTFTQNRPLINQTRPYKFSVVLLPMHIPATSHESPLRVLTKAEHKVTDKKQKCTAAEDIIYYWFKCLMCIRFLKPLRSPGCPVT